MTLNKALISQTALASELGRSRSGLYKLIKKDPTFPQPIKAGDTRQAAVFYVKEEVEQWIAAKIEARNARQAGRQSISAKSRRGSAAQ